MGYRSLNDGPMKPLGLDAWGYIRAVFSQFSHFYAVYLCVGHLYSHMFIEAGCMRYVCILITLEVLRSCFQKMFKLKTHLD